MLIDFLERRATDEAKGLLASHPNSISMITYYEVCHHFLKIGRSKELDFVKQKLSSFRMHPISYEICEEAARISNSNKLSVADSLILATAKVHDLSLATRDSDLKGKPGVIFLKSLK